MNKIAKKVVVTIYKPELPFAFSFELKFPAFAATP
jgi:hypothetical protein